MTLTIRRTGALGDVLAVTPLVKAFRAEHPRTSIKIETSYGFVFDGNPDLEPREQGADSLEDMFVDLDLAYERRPDMHIVDAYFATLMSDQSDAMKTMKFTRDKDWLNPNTVVIHAARSWASRTFRPDYWDGVAHGLRAMKLRPVFVGTVRDYGGPLWATNTLGRINVRQLASLISGAALFVGSDSGLLHLAGTTDVPIVGLYTSVRAKYRMPYRYGHLGWNMIGLEPGEDLTCRGCLARAAAPATNLNCSRGDNICTRSIAKKDVLQAAAQLLEDAQR